MNIMQRPSLIVSLETMERFVSWKPPVRMLGWFRDHLYHHRGVPVEGDNVSFVLDELPGEKIEVINGKELNLTSRIPPYVSCIRHGTRIHTRATVPRNELIFQYRRGVLPKKNFPFEGGHFNATPEFHRVIREVLELLDRLTEPGAADRIDLLALELVAEARRSLASLDTPQEVDPRIYRIAARMATECGRSGGVEEFAREYGMSRCAFYRAWRNYSETPPAEVLRENRLRLAVQMLTSTGLSLKEIASRCGFRDAVGLSQSFSARYGVSPREYVVRAATGQNGK